MDDAKLRPCFFHYFHICCNLLISFICLPLTWWTTYKFTITRPWKPSSLSIETILGLLAIIGITVSLFCFGFVDVFFKWSIIQEMNVALVFFKWTLQLLLIRYSCICIVRIIFVSEWFSDLLEFQIYWSFIFIPLALLKFKNKLRLILLKYVNL